MFLLFVLFLEEGLPPAREEYNEKTRTKTVTEYIFNDDGKKVKVILTGCPAIVVLLLFIIFSQSLSSCLFLKIS